jgi:hypothetical protein
MSTRDDILLGLRQVYGGGEVGDLGPEELLNTFEAEVLSRAADAVAEMARRFPYGASAQRAERLLITMADEATKGGAR